MSMEVTAFCISSEHKAEIRRLARRQRVSYSAIVRQALDRLIAESVTEVTITDTTSAQAGVTVPSYMAPWNPKHRRNDVQRRRETQTGRFAAKGSDATFKAK